jgi:hypothetical protein
MAESNNSLRIVNPRYSRQPVGATVWAVSTENVEETKTGFLVE